MMKALWTMRISRCVLVGFLLISLVLGGENGGSEIPVTEISSTDERISPMPPELVTSTAPDSSASSTSSTLENQDSPASSNVPPNDGMALESPIHSTDSSVSV